MNFELRDAELQTNRLLGQYGACFLQQQQRRSLRTRRAEHLSYEWKLANSAKLTPQKILAHVNRNKRMETRIQCLLHPDGSPATTDQEMADLLKQIFQCYYRTIRVHSHFPPTH